MTYGLDLMAKRTLLAFRVASHLRTGHVRKRTIQVPYSKTKNVLR